MGRDLTRLTASQVIIPNNIIRAYSASVIRAELVPQVLSRLNPSKCRGRKVDVIKSVSAIVYSTLSNILKRQPPATQAICYFITI